MKRIVILMTLVALLVQPALGLIPVAQAQGPVGEGEPEPGGMPGYPAPAKPIPHHEPGHLSRAGSYRTQVERENELGALEVVEISGVDAMAADGIDPLAGNYSLVNWDRILLSWYDATNDRLDWRSLKYDNKEFLWPSEPYVDESVSYNDITAADLNGDGQAEKIIVYIEEGGGWFDDNLIIQTSEMKGYLRATSAPAAVADSDDGPIDLVVRGYDDALWHRDGSTWNNQSATNSPALLSGPAMAARGAGAFDVFVISADNQIYRGSFDGSTWSGWILIDGQGIWPALDAWCGPTPELPAPAVVARGNKLDLFRLGPDNTLRWLHSEDGSTWGAWQNLGGMISTGLGVVSQNEDHMQVYARGVDETLWYLTYDNGSWGSWQRVTETMDGGVTIASAPAVLSPDEIYVRGSDNHLWRYDGSGWTELLGGELASGVAVTTGSPKFIALAHDGSLQQSHDGENWSDFDPLPYGSARHELLSATILRTPDWPWQEPENIWVDVETGNFLGNCRRQVAVAYQGGQGGSSPVPVMDITIYEIGAGFVPIRITSLVESGTWIVPEYPPRITAADVDGDGTDEIAVVYVKKWADDPFPVLPGRYYVLRIFDIVPEGDTWKLESLKDPDPYLGIEEKAIFAGFAGTLQIASGDINGDGADEVAIISDWVDLDQYNPVCVDDYWIRFLIYYPETDESFEDALHRKDIYAFDDFSEAFRTGVALAAGDVTGDDGKDEFVRTWPADCNGNGIDFGDWPNMERGLDVIRGTDVITPTIEPACATPDGIDYTYLDRLAVGDVDRDLVDEVVLFGYRRDKDPEASYLEVFNYSYPKDENDPSLDSEASYAWFPRYIMKYVSKTGLALGPLSGESIRVGRPSYRVQNRVDSLEAVINMPPKHRDLVKDGNGGYQRIDVLNEPCWDTPNDPRCTHAKHGTKAGTESKLENTVQRDWTIGAGLDSKVDNGGWFVDTSLKYSYGENFTDVHGSIKSTNFSGYASAYEHDKIVYYGTPCAVWEYPVFADNTTEPTDYMTVIFPVVNQSNPQTPAPDTMTGDYPGEPWYFPRHQTYNVWSYDPIGEVRFEDYDADNLILDRTISGGGDWFEVSQNTSDELVRITTQKHDFSAEVGCGYKGEVEIPFFSISFGVEYRAHVKGSYKQEEIETDKLTTSEQTQFSAFIAEQDTADAFEIRPIAYWSKNGYLVLDYQTDMGDWGTWEAYYDKPDPAFTLPWYGFPDPNEPIPPTSEELKLFSQDIQIDPPFASVGDTVTISATVRNFSNVAPDKPVTVRFYQGDPAADGVAIGEEAIPNLDRLEGPQTVSINWTASGVGKQKIYAVIDPGDAIDEVHDEGDLIDNNVAYGRIQVGATDYVDMGLASEQAYKRLTYRMGDTLVLSTYVPPGNLSEIVRFELKDADLTIPGVVGRPFELLAYLGKRVSDPPETNFSLKPESDDPPAVIGLAYSDADIAGRNEADLKLYRLWGSGGMEATCPGYQIHRFPADNLLLVPICQTGIFAFLDTAPEQRPIYLPLILKNSQ